MQNLIFQKGVCFPPDFPEIDRESVTWLMFWRGGALPTIQNSALQPFVADPEAQDYIVHEISLTMHPTETP